MEIEIKKLIEQLTLGNYQNLIPLKLLVQDYIKSFRFDPQVVKYTNVIFVFKAYSFFNRFFPNDTTKTMLKDFIINVANHCITEFNRLDLNHIDRVNNFQAHRLRIVSTAGYVLGIENYIKWSEFQLKAFIGFNLRKDGTNLDLKIRDSLSYLVYTLEPLVETCLNIHKTTKKNYFFYESDYDTSISKSVRYLIPFVKGYETNVMFKNSVYDSDKLKEDYLKNWDSVNARNLFNLSCNFDRSLIGYF